MSRAQWGLLLSLGTASSRGPSEHHAWQDLSMLVTNVLDILKVFQSL